MLTDNKIKHLKPRDIPYPTADANGLTLYTLPTGSKSWRLRYRFNGKSNTLAMGKYPLISLKDARALKDKYLSVLAKGTDPKVYKKQQKIVQQEKLTFQEAFNIWLAKHKDSWIDRTVEKQVASFEKHIFPYIGEKYVEDIKTPDMAAVLERMDSKGISEVLKKVKRWSSRVFQDCVVKGVIQYDPMANIPNEHFKNKNVKHFATVTSEDDIKELLPLLETYKKRGTYQIGAALNLAPYLLLRPGELCKLTWGNIEFKNRLIRISQGDMKMRREHVVPMSRQVLSIFKEIKMLDLCSTYVFPSPNKANQPIDPASLREAIKRLGVPKEKFTTHGFRSMASTRLNEMGFNRDWIEVQLANVDANSVRGIYNNALYFEQRVDMMQKWSDYLDGLKSTHVITEYILQHLEHPLDVNKILRKKKSIKKYLLLQDDLIEKNIAILGGSTTSELKNILEIFLLKNGIKPKFYESEYNKYYEDALFGSDELAKFNPDIIYIHTTNQNIIKYPDSKDTSEDVAVLLSNEMQRYKSIWNSLSKFDCAIIQNNFDYTKDRSLGNLDCYDIHGKTYFINKLNDEFSLNARKIKNLYINDINYLSSYIGLRYWFDPSLWYQAKYAISMESIPELAFNIGKITSSIFGKSKKCLVLDLDNTCWGGVIGDDGLDRIHIGTETAISESYTAFQKYVKELKNRGVTLAVCSKNDFENAKEGFSHPESSLKFDDFTSFKANWNPKNHNILDIAKSINIGVDSLVFIDDNPVERDIVLSQVPSVSVPDVGSDVVEFIAHIDRNGYFEPISIADDDINRNQYYKDNKKRANKQATFKSYDEFLVSLDMTAEIKSFSSVYLDRISQLINKTNQFNLTTKRYTTGEIDTITLSDEYIKVYGKLTDKYGSNGLIAISIGRIENRACHIDLWLMSCRVLKRDMEFAMLDELVSKCKDQDVSEIIGYYYKSPKNSMVSDLYEKFGFNLLERNDEDSVWKLDITNYEIKNKFIGVDND